MKFEEIKNAFLNGDSIKRKNSIFIYQYQGLKKNSKTGQEFHSVINVDETGKFKGYAKIGFNDILGNDWLIVNQVKETVKNDKTNDYLEEVQPVKNELNFNDLFENLL